MDDDELLAQISSGAVEWSGFGIVTTFLSIVTRVESGLIQPMEELIIASSEEGATSLLEDMIEAVKEDASYQNHLYTLPYSFENVMFNWRSDLFAELGYTERPQTWDDWHEMATEMKQWGAEQGIFATSFANKLWTDVGALLSSAMDNPYDDEGLLAWKSPEAAAALQFYRKMVEGELTPPHGFDGWLKAFQQGKVASVQAQSSRGVWVRTNHGQDNMTTSPIATREVGSGSGSAFWGNGLSVVNKAPYTQEVVDFYVFAQGPANRNFHKAVIESGKTPVYNSVFDEILNDDPLFSTYGWMNDMRKDVTRSRLVPRNTYYSIQNKIYKKRIVEFIDDPSITPEQCASLIFEDSRAEIAKQKAQ